MHCFTKPFSHHHIRVSAAYNFIYCRMTITFGTITPIQRIRFIWRYYFSSSVFIIRAFRLRREAEFRFQIYPWSLHFRCLYCALLNLMTASNEIYALKCLGNINLQASWWFRTIYIFLLNARSKETPQFGESQKKQQGTKCLLIDAIASMPCLPPGTKESCINTSSRSTSADKNTA